MSLRSSVKSVVAAVLPERAFSAILAYRSRNHQIQYVRNLGMPADNEAFVRSYGNTIRRGPFQGMNYPALELGVRPAVQYLVGSVEQELHGILQVALARSYDCVLNIGCAQGYYAVGFAWLKKIPSYAFDPEFRERSYCRTLARANQVEHLVKIKSWFSVNEMEQFAGQRCLVICDCEGYETNLFNSESTPHTVRWDLLVELHGPEAESQVPQALSQTHRTTLIAAEPRRVEDYPMLEGVIQNPSAALSENRPMPSYWLWAESRLDNPRQPG